MYSTSDNCYIDSVLFYVFADQLFIPKTRHITGQKLFILDGSHLDIYTIQLSRANNMHLYCLPPHTSHIFQPLDVLIFHLVKSHFSQLKPHGKPATLGWKKPVNCCKTNFTRLFKESWESKSSALVKTGFRKWIDTPLIKSDSLNIKNTIKHYIIWYNFIAGIYQWESARWKILWRISNTSKQWKIKYCLQVEPNGISKYTCKSFSSSRHNTIAYPWIVCNSYS